MIDHDTKKIQVTDISRCLEGDKQGTDKPTRIMYLTNLSWKPLMEVLDSLTAQDLIVVRKYGDRKRYDITEKGSNVLGYMSRAMETIKIK